MERELIGLDALLRLFSSSRVPQFDFVASVWLKTHSPIDAEHLHLEPIAIDANDHVMIRTRSSVHTRPDKMFQRHFA